MNRLKIALVGLSLLAGAPEVFRRVVMLFEPSMQIVALAAFGLLLALCTVSLVGAASFRHGFLRWPLAALLAAGSATVDGYQWVVGSFMDYDAFVTMIQSSGDVGNALTQHGTAIVLAIGKSLALLLGIGLKPAATANIMLKLARLFALPIILTLTLILFYRGGDGASGLPSSHIGVSFGLLNGYEHLTEGNTPREAVAFRPVAAESAGDIVLIIDESIAGAYLDINSEHGVYSGLADPKTASPVFNFGLAAAVTTCSAGANATLRYGGARGNYRQAFRSKPSIWAYAKAANLETIYVDAQRTGGAYQNLMDNDERALIDRWDQFDDVRVLDRDHAVASRLAEYLQDSERQFILVNKIGAHFPVNDKFPNSHARYSPMLQRKSLDVSEAPADELDGRQSNWVLYRNSYRNTLLWNVGAFFDRFFAEAEIGDSTIIYTSDHGQTFHERREYGEATHCTGNTQIEEAVVPLVVIGGPARDHSRWAQAAQQNHDKQSTYRVFPTLLGLMGYAETDFEKTYGNNILSDQPDPFTFNDNFSARLGSDPVWIPIPLSQIAQPPASDYEREMERDEQ